MLHFFRVTLARRERRKRRASRTKIIKRIPFEQHSTGRNIPADKSHTSQCIYKLTIKEISQKKKKKKKNERAYVLIPQTFGTRRMGNTDSMQITIPPSPSSKEATFALFPADSHRGGKGGEEGGGGKKEGKKRSRVDERKRGIWPRTRRRRRGGGGKEWKRGKKERTARTRKGGGGRGGGQKPSILFMNMYGEPRASSRS